MSRFTKSMSLLLLVVSLASACAPSPAEAPAVAVESTEAVEPSPTTEPVATAEPTAAPEPTATTEPEPAEPEAAEPEPDDVQINVYISPDSLGQALEEAFEAQHGDVLGVVGGSWCRKLNSELEAGDIQADVIYGAEPIYYRGLASKDALFAYTSPEVANLIPELQWDNGFYVPADLRYIGIAYNNTLVDAADIPTTFAGLNDPQWDQLTTVPDATQCASAFAIAAALAQPDGDMSFYEAAKANHTLLSDRAGKLPETVASGEAVMGISPHDPVVRMQNKAKKEGVESPVSIIWADDGVYVLPRPIAIIADENRSDEMTAVAQAFVDFVLSAEGQNIAVRKGGYVPARAGIDGPQMASGDLDLLQVDWDWAAKNKPDIQAAFKAIMYGD
jgi:iron(III) transport system substrate-binding protein